MTDMTDNIVYGYYRIVSKVGKKTTKTKWYRVAPKGDSPKRVFALLETVYCSLPHVELDICLEPKNPKDCAL